MDLSGFRLDLLSHVPGVIAIALEEDALAGTSLPALVRGEVLIDAGRFDRATFESVLGSRAPDHVRAGDAYRGTFDVAPGSRTGR